MSLRNQVKQNKSTFVVNLLAILLMVGGAVGVGIGIWTDVQMFQQRGLQSSAAMALMGCFLLLFGLSLWTGVNLWRRKGEAFTWARIIFALQIPNISAPGLSYTFFTGSMLSAILNVKSGTIGLEFRIASYINFEISHNIQEFTIGVNLIALAALLYLISVPAALQGPSTQSSGA